MMMVTQSGPGTVFTLVSLISAGLITVKAALPVIIGLNLDASALIFVATIEVKALVLLLLGIVLIEEGAEPLAARDMTRQAPAATGGSLLLGLLAARDKRDPGFAQRSSNRELHVRACRHQTN
ncbi:hypothetical protein [Algihabitans albus]|uniref:hypothetical protein n=1 Tax=Algihabitans albus TaxID=2164067 RepID=UPI000E5C79B7|nr:hypothetical protein [Algihabitans albus]